MTDVSPLCPIGAALDARPSRERLRRRSPRSARRLACNRVGALAATLALLPLSPAPASGQVEGLVSSLFSTVEGIAISYNFVQLDDGSFLESDGSCLLSEACGAQAEILIDLAAFNNRYSVELGLSASFMRGFKARSDEVDIRGSTRSFPTVGAYISYDLCDPVTGGCTWSPYVGMSFGLSELWNANAYDTSGRIYDLEGETFDWSLIAAIARKTGPGWLFLEAAYTWRTFASLAWTLPSAANEALPAAFPRSLELGGPRVNIGFQFRKNTEES